MELLVCWIKASAGCFPSSQLPFTSHPPCSPRLSPALQPSTLAALLREPAGTLVPRLVALVDLLPGCDVGWLAAAEPELLLLRPLDAIRADVARLGELLGPGVWWASGVLDVGALVQQQPRFLDAELVRCGCGAAAQGLRGAGG